MKNLLLPRAGGKFSASGQQTLQVTTALTSVAAFIVILRFIAKLGVMKTRGREDVTILAALVCSFVYGGMVVAQVYLGLGKPVEEVTHEQMLKQIQCLWLAIPFYNASLGCTKFSILFQYLRLFPSRRFHTGCYVVMGIVASYTTWAVISAFFNCTPVAKFWDRGLPGTCLSFEVIWLLNASMNMATDFALLIMPMPVLSQLRLPRIQKVALMGIFAIGGLVPIMSILRISSLVEVSTSPAGSWSNVGGGADYWTAAEINVAITSACLPFLRPIVSFIFPTLLSSNNESPVPSLSSMFQRRGKQRSPYHDTELLNQTLDEDIHTVRVDDSKEHFATSETRVVT